MNRAALLAEVITERFGPRPWDGAEQQPPSPTPDVGDGDAPGAERRIIVWNNALYAIQRAYKCARSTG